MAKEMAMKWLSMRCPNCRNDFPRGGKYCPNCGKKMEQHSRLYIAIVLALAPLVAFFAWRDIRSLDDEPLNIIPILLFLGPSAFGFINLYRWFRWTRQDYL
ncbi:MAG: hypothetical protein JSU93_03155 [Methanobacteriota archaeon]|nr:MAG: hypothetical protein JSU93_03155 [Euryarchaeota archaeon]